MKIISFSGIDGAGKTTQICAFENWLRAGGLNVKVLTFWDNVAAFSSLREKVSSRAFGGDQGIGSPEKPLNRRDKNVTSWPVCAMRFLLYCADAISLRRKISKIKKQDESQVVIFDRYIYDELANLPLQQGLVRLFAGILLSIVAKPDIAYLIDADPVAARARKPEYPLEFLHSNRQAYLALSRLVGSITVIDPGSIEEAESRIRQVFLRRVSAPEGNLSGLPALP